MWLNPQYPGFFEQNIWNKSKIKYNFGAAASKMEFFVTIVNGWKLRPIDARNFVLHAAEVRDLKCMNF